MFAVAFLLCLLLLLCNQSHLLKIIVALSGSHYSLETFYLTQIKASLLTRPLISSLTHL